MSITDLTFIEVSTSDPIYDPLSVSSTPIGVTIQNNGTTTMEDMGIYIGPASLVGDVDNPGDNSPYTDYQDIIEWGTAVDGGLRITGTYIGGAALDEYVTSAQGSTFTNRIVLGSLAAAAEHTVYFAVEPPAGSPARRLFVDIMVE